MVHQVVLDQAVHQDQAVQVEHLAQVDLAEHLVQVEHLVKEELFGLKVLVLLVLFQVLKMVIYI
jgi:hypothetical protein